VRIPNFIGKQMSGASKWLGKLKFLGTHISTYATALILAFTATSTYSVSIRPWLIEQGIDLPFIFYVAVVVVFIGILFIFDYKAVMPGFFSLWNKQWYEHDNQMVVDIKELKEQLDRIERLLEKK
jgi:hypothetical protein